MITHYRRPSPVLDDEIIVWFLNENHRAGLRGISAFLIHVDFKASGLETMKINHGKTKNAKKRRKIFAPFVPSWLIYREGDEK
jgi:hypothetical protein